jgi:hypothetical protein
MEKLIQETLEFTEKKNQMGLLVWNEIPEFDNACPNDYDDFWSTPDGDRETLFSIAGMYSQFAPDGISVDECREKLEDILCEKYPKFCD